MNYGYSYDNFRNKYSESKEFTQNDLLYCKSNKAHLTNENEVQKRVLSRNISLTKPTTPKDRNKKINDNWKAITSSTFYGDSGPLLSKLYTVPDELLRYFEIYDGTEGVLGRGAYSSVFKIRSKRSGNIYALKVMSVEHFTCRGLASQLRREIHLQSQCYHPNIVQIYKCIEHCGYVFLILEYVDTNLFNILHKKKKNQVIRAGSRRNRYIPTDELISEVEETLFSRNEIVSYISQLLKAVNYLHEMSIVHRDIKPENILVSYEGRVKLGDFGWCGDLCRRCSSMAGTFCYMAPEILKGEKQSAKVDSWSIGILLFELYVGNVPFVPPPHNENQGNSSQVVSMLNSIREISKEARPKRFPADAWNLCCWLLRCNPIERASPLQALNHPFLSEVNLTLENSPTFHKKSEIIYSTPKIKQETISNMSGSTFTALPLVALPTPTSRITRQKEREIKRMSTEVPSNFLINDFNKSNHSQNYYKYNPQIYEVGKLEYSNNYHIQKRNFNEVPNFFYPTDLNMGYKDQFQIANGATFNQDKLDKITHSNYYNNPSQINYLNNHQFAAIEKRNSLNRYTSQPPVYYQQPLNNQRKNHYVNRNVFEYRYQ